MVHLLPRIQTEDRNVARERPYSYLELLASALDYASLHSGQVSPGAAGATAAAAVPARPKAVTEKVMAIISRYRIPRMWVVLSGRPLLPRPLRTAS